MVETVVSVPQTDRFLDFVEEMEDLVEQYADPVLGMSIPDDNCCTVWQDDNYSSNHIDFCTTSSNWWSLSDLGFNDRVSSFACGKNTMIRMCDDSNYVDDGCNNHKGVSGSAGTYTSHNGYEDSLSSV